MHYTIKAIETKFKDFVFRSRLEAKWAAMFEQLGWNWDYEPVDFNGWIPDFVIYGENPVYVEVKPVIEFPRDVANQMERSGCKNEMLIVGQRCLIKGSGDTSFYGEGLCFGWMTEKLHDIEYADEKDWWEPATFGRWSECNGRIGFCHSVGSFVDRVSGNYDGGSFGCREVNGEEIKRLWANAHNVTRWMKVSS